MTIRARLLSLLFIIAAVVVGIVVAHYLEFHSLKETATAVNLAGSLRFRTNKVALLVHDYLDAATADERAVRRKEIDAEVAYVERIFVSFHGGDPGLGLEHAPTDSAAFLAQLGVVERDWQSFKAGVYKVVSGSGGVRGLQDLRGECHVLVLEIHKAVGILESVSRETVLNDIKIDLFSLIAVMLGFLIILLTMKKRVLAPLKAVEGFAGRLGTGDLQARLHFHNLLAGRDEIGVLARTLNDMAARLQEIYDTLEKKVQDRTEELTATNEELIASQAELRDNYATLEKIHAQLKATQDALIQAEKCSSIGTLAAGVAHEINNPLAAIIGYAEGLIRDVEKGSFDSERSLKALRKLCDAGWRCARIVGALKAYARQGDVVMNPENINHLLEDALSLTAPQLREKNIEVRKELCDGLSDQLVECDGGKIRQVLVNLLMNSCDAVSSSGGEITIKSFRKNGAAVVEVSDTGPGIPDEAVSKVFDPFYTTKEIGHGMGLGLAVVRGIIDCHDGDITVDSKPGEGTRITFSIPFMRKSQTVEAGADAANGLGRYDDATSPAGYKKI